MKNSWNSIAAGLLSLLGASCDGSKPESAEHQASRNVEFPDRVSLEVRAGAAGSSTERPPAVQRDYSVESIDINNRDELRERNISLIAKLKTTGASSIPDAVKLANEAMSWGWPDDFPPQDVIAVGLTEAVPDPRSNGAEVHRYLDALLRTNLNEKVKGAVVIRYTGDCLRLGDHIESIVDIVKSATQLDAASLETVYSLYADADPQKATSDIIAGKWSERMQGATAAAFAQYAAQEPKAASERVREMEGTPGYDWAVAGLIQGIRATDHEAADIWRAELVSPEAIKEADRMTFTGRY